jgi:hypothetical protein
MDQTGVEPLPLNLDIFCRENRVLIVSIGYGHPRDEALLSDHEAYLCGGSRQITHRPYFRPQHFPDFLPRNASRSHSEVSRGCPRMLANCVIEKVLINTDPVPWLSAVAHMTVFVCRLRTALLGLGSDAISMPPIVSFWKSREHRHP